VAIIVMVFFVQAEDGIRDFLVTGVQTCALPIFTSQAHNYFIVIAEVKLTPCAEVILTPLGEDGGLLSRRDVDPGASSGDQGFRTTRSLDSADHERDGVVA